MSSHGPRSALLLLVAATVPACFERTTQEVTPLPSGQTASAFPVALNENLDLLFVIDDSDSMQREQEQLMANAGRMIEVLEHLPGGRPNLHIGVISTDVGTGCDAPAVPGGVLRNQPNPSNDPRLEGCTGPSDRYLVDVLDEASGDRVTNYDGELSDAFACVATLGTGGCGFEAPLEALHRALSPYTTENAGFLRDDAMLAVVFLTDEDDCSAFDPRLFAASPVVDNIQIGPRTSFRCFAAGTRCNEGSPWPAGPRTDCEPDDDSPFMTPVSDYVTSLRELRPGPGRLLLAGIMGDPTVVVENDGETSALKPSCRLAGGTGTGTETAFPPVRTDAFLGSFEGSVRESICAADLAPAIVRIGEEIAQDLWGRCIDGDLHDADPRLGGIQPECTVSEILDPDAPELVENVLPPCGLGGPSRACWTTGLSPDLCRREQSQLEMRISYPPGTTRPPTTEIRFQCRLR